MTRARVSVAVAVPLLLASCGPAPETTKPAAVPRTSAELYEEGHRLYMMQQYDSARGVLEKAVAVDPSSVHALKDLAQLTYDLGMPGEGEARSGRRENLTQSRTYYEQLEALGLQDADVYERLCQSSIALADTPAFARWAKKYATRFPFDRQYYNLGIACYDAGDYQSVIKSQKEAIEKFKGSPYTSGFYRQLGHAYMKVDRDQTAERTFTAGIREVESQLAHLKEESPTGAAQSEHYRRLVDDRVNMLLALRRLHAVYGAKDKLRDVERQLQQAGYRE